MRARYVLRRGWDVEAPVDAVREVLDDLERYPEWWPQVLAVAKVTDDDARVLCRSTLPYTLDLLLHAERTEAEVLEVSVSGTLEGWVRWRLRPVGFETPPPAAPQPAGRKAVTRVELEQEVGVGGALALASYAARPVLVWNHRRMLDGCQRGLRERLGLRPG